LIDELFVFGFISNIELMEELCERVYVFCGGKFVS